METTIICRLDPLTEDERVELLALADRLRLSTPPVDLLRFARDNVRPQSPRKKPGRPLSRERQKKAFASTVSEVNRACYQPVLDERTSRYREDLLQEAREIDEMAPSDARTEDELRQALRDLAARLGAIADLELRQALRQLTDRFAAIANSDSPIPSLRIVAYHRSSGRTLAEAVNAIVFEKSPELAEADFRALEGRKRRHRERAETE